MASAYDRVTDRIIAQLQSGVRPWSQEWQSVAGGGRPLRADGQKYRGANVVNLWSAAMERSFSSPYWMTFKRSIDLGARVRKGARSELAFYVGKMTRMEERDGEEIERHIPFLKSYCVFNADEIEGLPAHFYPAAALVPVLDPAARNAAVDTWIDGTGAKIVYGGGRAFYRHRLPALTGDDLGDDIHLPEFGNFNSAAAFYGTALHELTHWTGDSKRVDRTKGKFFGDPAYAFEELVAELGAAFLSADLGVSTEVREDHAAYLAGWLKVLKSDNRAIFSAAAHAERAAEYLHKLHGVELATVEPFALAA